MKKHCFVCDREFEPPRSDSKCCSKKCKRKMYNQRIPKLEFGCVHCGEKFLAKKKDSQYCSMACFNRHTKKHDDVCIVCVQCGTEFQVPYMKRDRIVCSLVCRTSYNNENRDKEAVAKKISETKKRQFASGEVIHPWIGKTHSEETKRKISETRIRRGSSVGEKNPMFGKHHTTETKEKISNTRSQKILDGEYNGWFKKGEYFSEKLGRSVVYRSSWEERVYKHLDIQQDILIFQEEPLRILYKDPASPQHRNYIPDILITFKDGTRKLVEIKPSCFLDAAINQAKFTAAREYCQKRNIIFEVWTENEIQNLLTEEG